MLGQARARQVGLRDARVLVRARGSQGLFHQHGLEPERLFQQQALAPPELGVVLHHDEHLGLGLGHQGVLGALDQVLGELLDGEVAVDAQEKHRKH